MNLRIAKKVLKGQHRTGRPVVGWDGTLTTTYIYNPSQKNAAAHRIFRRACRHGDAKSAWAALQLKPENSFTVDDQVDLKFEWLKGQELRGEKLTISTKDIVPPPPIAKPAFRRDGQVHSFSAVPFPGAKRSTVTLARYQVRDQNRRAQPKRSVADFAGLTPEQDNRRQSEGLVEPVEQMLDE